MRRSRKRDPDRRRRSAGGWFNWYVDRGRLTAGKITAADLRRLSWRRVH